LLEDVIITGQLITCRSSALGRDTDSALGNFPITVSAVPHVAR
jgi:hypothetical protein